MLYLSWIFLSFSGSLDEAGFSFSCLSAARPEAMMSTVIMTFSGPGSPLSRAAGTEMRNRELGEIAASLLAAREASRAETPAVAPKRPAALAPSA